MQSNPNLGKRELLDLQAVIDRVEVDGWDLASAGVTGPWRMLLVHAHPDDESIATGATIAAAVRAGVEVTLLTCSRGELGEVLVAELAALTADRCDTLGDHRVGELAAAMDVLGVRDHRFLDDPEHPRGFRDSGMAGSPANDDPDCLARADLLGTACAVTAVLREVRPHVLVTYDPDGGYGHPDHIAAHRAAMYAAELAAAPFRPDLGPSWTVPRIYWAATPRAVTLRGLDEAGRGLAAGELTDPHRAADPANWRRHPDPATVLVTEDSRVTTRIDATAELDTKRSAMAAHATQLAVSGDRFALTNGIAQPLSGIEWYTLVRGVVVPGPDGFETDLFAGLTDLDRSQPGPASAERG